MFSQIATCGRTLASIHRVLRDNVWILLRLTCCVVTGVLLILSSSYVIWKTRSPDSVYKCLVRYNTICSMHNQPFKKQSCL